MTSAPPAAMQLWRFNPMSAKRRRARRRGRAKGDFRDIERGEARQARKAARPNCRKGCAGTSDILKACQARSSLRRKRLHRRERADRRSISPLMSICGSAAREATFSGGRGQVANGPTARKALCRPAACGDTKRRNPGCRAEVSGAVTCSLRFAVREIAYNFFGSFLSLFRSPTTIVIGDLNMARKFLPRHSALATTCCLSRASHALDRRRVARILGAAPTRCCSES